METVGVRELKSELSRYLRRVRAGARLTVTERGKAIGNGAVATGKFTGHKRVPVARGQAIPAWDPRPLKATGVTYATSPMGADHTAGLIINPGMQPDEFAEPTPQHAAEPGR